MERVNVLCLFLLCSLLGAELRNSEINEQIEEDPDSVNEQEQSSDVHAMLRQLRAKFTVLKTMMVQLKTLNQEQAAKLRELQTNGVDLMKEQLRDQAAELNDLKARVNVTENQVDTLRRDRAVKQVAFSASLMASNLSTLTIGPFKDHTTLVFRNVVTNIGNAYNPDTGVFIAPVRGAYHFEFYIYAPGPYTSGAVLVKNEQHVFIAWEEKESGWGTSSNGVSLLLEAEDVVFLRLYKNTQIYDNVDRPTTFSGHLLFLM